MSGNRDLQLVEILVIITFFFILVPPFNNTPVRSLLGIIMVLFLPGYSLIAALFPRKNDLDGIERLALSFGFSIAVAPLIGLGLNFTPFGIRLVAILVSLSIFTLAMCLIAHFQRSKLSDEERFEVPFSFMYYSLESEMSSSKKGVDRILTIILIFSILFSIITLIYVIVTPKQGEKFTEFYILGPEGKADNYTTDLKYNSPSHILIGVANREYIPVNYTVQLVLDNGILTDTWFKLGHNETWERNVTYVPEKTGENIKLEFLLFKEDNFTAPYRELNMWVNIEK